MNKLSRCRHSVPNEISRLQKLHSLTLNGNLCEESIHVRFVIKSYHKITTITDLSLSHNQLSGKLPDLNCKFLVCVDSEMHSLYASYHYAFIVSQTSIPLVVRLIGRICIFFNVSIDEFLYFFRVESISATLVIYKTTTSLSFIYR